MWARRQDGRQALPCQATTLPKAALAGWRKNKIAEGVRILTVRAKFMAAARVLAAVIRARILTTIRRAVAASNPNMAPKTGQRASAPRPDIRRSEERRGGNE